MQGTIKKIIGDRGFGFISVESETDDIFFHRSQYEGNIPFEDLNEGQLVEFELEDSEKGPQAVKVNTV